MRTLEQIDAEIAEHEAALKALSSERSEASYALWSSHHNLFTADSVMITERFVTYTSEQNDPALMRREWPIGSEAFIGNVKEKGVEISGITHGFHSVPVEIVKEMRQAWLDAQVKEQSNA